MLEALVEVLGRTHPLVLHLPIGLLVALGAMEVWSMVSRPSKETHREPASPTLLVVLAGASAVISAMSGLILSLEDQYAGDVLQLHQWLGIAVGVLSLVLVGLHLGHAAGRAGLRLPYRVVLGLTLAVLVPAGHFGAEMTHGAGFLTEPLRARPEPARPGAGGGELAGPSEQPPTARLAFAALEARCFSCHGEKKQRGGLRLDSIEHILAGGDTGPAVVATSPEQSELFVRITLPQEDEYHMPPEGRTQLTPEEIEVIRRWIEQGAKDPA